jgi:hypothetical protein
MKVLLFRIPELVVESIRILNHSRQKVLFTGREAQKSAHSTPNHLSRHMFQGAICSDSLGLQPAWACRSTRSFAGRGRSWQDMKCQGGVLWKCGIPGIPITMFVDFQTQVVQHFLFWGCDATHSLCGDQWRFACWFSWHGSREDTSSPNPPA